MNKESLLKEAETFGLTLIGDGATIKRAPLMNILDMCGNTPPIIVGIEYCSEHMANGGKEDATYIALLFGAKVVEYDPWKVLTNFFFFDVTSNVHKGGKTLTVQYSRTYCLHRGEHVCSLYYLDIAKFPPIKAREYVYIPFVVLMFLYTNCKQFIHLTNTYSENLHTV